MKKSFTIIFVFFLITPGFSQIELTNVKSEAHQYISDSEIFIIPPDNFFNLGKQGFVFPAAGAMIMVSKIPNSNYQSILEDLDGILKDQKLIGLVEDVLINGIAGKFFTSEEVRDGDPFTNHSLFLGNDESVYLIMGICPSDHPGIIESIKRSIFSVVYESDL